jgi:ABC-type multidrug transport system fused ATPase/permease subunit
MQIFKKLLFLLTSKERKQASLLLVMIIIMAFLEMIGVASIMPFIAVLTNPSLVETNVILNYMFQISNSFGVGNQSEFLFFLGALVFVLLITSLLFKSFTIYAQLRFVYMREYSISKRLVECYLNQPYAWFLNRNSADLGKSILSEVATVVGSGMGSIMELISKSMVTVAILCLLTFTDLKLTIIVGFTFSIFYGLIYMFSRSYLSRIGIQRLKTNQLRFTAVNEAFGAAKEVKVGRLEKIYTKLFSDPAKIYARCQSSSKILSQLPRFAIEGVAFGGMVLVILYLMLQKGTFVNALPIVAVYAFGGYRLMPALQQIYSSINQLRFIGPAIDDLYNDFSNLKPIKLNDNSLLPPLNKSIKLKNIYYDYPNASRKALKNINLEIIARTTIGLVGATGSGKTTAADIILGLIEPKEGYLEVDGQIINKNNIVAWQSSIGYVPQHIYLSDNTIAANIAFGQNKEDINYEAVEKVSKIANLHEFVVNDLPKKYQTNVGERGIRLSGGQRQRIGIARALYHNPQVLILDEATSALDNLTEKAVMDAVNNLGKNITIILIAHRLSTVKNCDTIYILESGEIKNKGTFEELTKTNKYFQLTNTNFR